MKTYTRYQGPDTIRPVLNGTEDALITRDQAARLLSVNIRTVDRLARQGKFRTYYQGALVRFLKSEVINCFESPNLPGQ